MSTYLYIRPSFCSWCPPSVPSRALTMPLSILHNNLNSNMFTAFLTPTRSQRNVSCVMQLYHPVHDNSVSTAETFPRLSPL